MAECECLFSITYGPRDVFRSPYMIDPECKLHGVGGTDRCQKCRSLSVPCRCGEVVEKAAQVRYFFDKDNSGHDYIVRADRRSEWEAWLKLPEDDERSWDVPDGLAERCGCHPSSYTFTDVKEATK